MNSIKRCRNGETRSLILYRFGFKGKTDSLKLFSISKINKRGILRDLILHEMLDNWVVPIEKIKLLDVKDFLNVKDKYGRIPLRVALEKRSRDEILELLITEEILNSDTYLHKVLYEKKSINIIKKFITKENVNMTDGGDTPLHLLLKKNYTIAKPYEKSFYDEQLNEIINLLITKENLNMTNRFDETPLHLALRQECPGEFIRLLITKENLNFISNRNTPLHTALQANFSKEVYSKDILKLLITEENMNMNGFHGIPPLSIAVETDYKQSEEIIKLLFTKENANKVNSSKCTPLIMAIYRDLSNEIIEYLITDENKNIETNVNVSPLSFYLCKKDLKIEVINLLISKKSLNFKDNYGRTPLHFYLTKTNLKIEIINKLITEENLNAQDEEGNTPLHIAVEEKLDTGIIKLLITKRNVYIKNKNNMIPLDIVRKKY